MNTSFHCITTPTRKPTNHSRFTTRNPRARPSFAPPCPHTIGKGMSNPTSWRSCALAFLGVPERRWRTWQSSRWLQQRWCRFGTHVRVRYAEAPKQFSPPQRACWYRCRGILRTDYRHQCTRGDALHPRVADAEIPFSFEGAVLHFGLLRGYPYINREM